MKIKDSEETNIIVEKSSSRFIDLQNFSPNGWNPLKFRGVFHFCLHVSFWTIPGPSLDHPLTIPGPGPSLDHPWTIPGPSLVHPWTIPGSSLDHPWTIPGPSLDHPGTIPGPSLDPPWTIPGPPLDASGSDPALTRPWTDFSNSL